MENAIGAASDTFAKAIKTMRNRKRIRGTGKLLSRGVTFYLSRPASEARWKLVMREDEPGDLDWVIDELSRLLDAHVIHDLRHQDGMLAMSQVMEDLNQTLLGIDTNDVDKVPMFDAHYQATRRRRLNQVMGDLRDIEAEDTPRIKELEAQNDTGPPRCTELNDDGTKCDQRLHVMALGHGPDWFPPRDEESPNGHADEQPEEGSDDPMSDMTSQDLDWLEGLSLE